MENPRGRGGRHQRTTRRDNANPAGGAAGRRAGSESNVGKWLVQQVLWGFLSPQVAQHVAKKGRDDIEYAVKNDMRTGYSDLNVLAGLGSEGRHPQHMYSDLIKKLDPPHIDRFECTLPLKLHEKNPRDHVQHMLLPHETFSKMYHMYPNQWKARMVPTDESINMFWSQMEGHPLLVDHPMKERDNWWELAVPYSIHIDGVPCVGVGKAWGKTMELFSWCSFLGLGSSMLTFLYIYGFLGGMYQQTLQRTYDA